MKECYYQQVYKVIEAFACHKTELSPSVTTMCLVHYLEADSNVTREGLG